MEQRSLTIDAGEIRKYDMLVIFTWQKKSCRENFLDKHFGTDHVEDQLGRATRTCILGNVLQNELALNTIQWWAMMVLTTEYILSQ